jgi:hypothetical protein
VLSQRIIPRRHRQRRPRVHHPACGGLLALPSLQQLLCQIPQRGKILGRVDHPRHALQLELLGRRQAEGGSH